MSAERANLPETINWKKNLFFVWLSQFLAMAGFGLCMPFIPLLLKQNLHVMDDQVRGFYVSIYYLAGMMSLCIASTVWGILADRYGRKIMLLRGSYAAALLYPLLAFAPNFLVLVLIRFVCSFFAGTVNPAQTLMVTTSPEEHHGFVLGTLSTSVWSGNMVGCLCGGMIVHYFGFCTAFISCGVIYLISGLLVHIFVKEDFHRPLKLEKTVSEPVAKHHFRDYVTPAIAWLLVMFLLLGIARRIEQPFVAMLVEIVDGEANAAFYTGVVSFAAAVGGVLSGVITGYLCDRFSPGKMLIPMLIASCVSLLLQAYAVNVVMLIAARFLAYFAAGSLQPLLQVLLTKVILPEKRGTYFGWTNSMNQGGGIVCAFISGGIAYFGSVRGIFLAAGLIFLLMVPLMIPTLRHCRKEASALQS